ncbi:MAG: tetratricopeptide repeat protein [Planctomycetota bacterium]
MRPAAPLGGGSSRGDDGGVWQRLKQIVGEVAELPSGERDTALIAACGGDFAGARDLHREVLATQEATLGGEDVLTLSTELALANVLAELAEHEEAAARYREVHEVYRRRYGEEHSRTLVVLDSLASALGNPGALRGELAAL